MTAPVRMYCTQVCPYCQMADRLLAKKGVTDYEKIFVDDRPELREEMTRRTGRRTVPQLYIGDKHVGGYTDLVQIDQEGRLDEMLQAG